MTNKKIKELNSKYVKFNIDENNILCLSFKVEHISLEIAKEITKERLEFTNGQDTNMYVEVTTLKSIDKTARDYFSSNEGNEKLKAVAIFTNSKLSFFLANFLLKVNFQICTIPVKIFTEKEKALAWLKNINTISDEKNRKKLYV